MEKPKLLAWFGAVFPSFAPKNELAGFAWL
jgi:hypothetical protein